MRLLRLRADAGPPVDLHVDLGREATTEDVLETNDETVADAIRDALGFALGGGATRRSRSRWHGSLQVDFECSSGTYRLVRRGDDSGHAATLRPLVNGKGGGKALASGWDEVTDALRALLGEPTAGAGGSSLVRQRAVHAALRAGGSDLGELLEAAALDVPWAGIADEADRLLSEAEEREHRAVAALHDGLARATAVLAPGREVPLEHAEVLARRSRLAAKVEAAHLRAETLRENESELTRLREEELERRRRREELEEADRRVRELEARQAEIDEVALRLAAAQRASAAAATVESSLAAAPDLAELERRERELAEAESARAAAARDADGARKERAAVQARSSERAALKRRLAELEDLATLLVELDGAVARLRSAEAENRRLRRAAGGADERVAAAEGRLEALESAKAEAGREITPEIQARVDSLRSSAEQAQGAVARRRRLVELSEARHEAVKCHARTRIQLQRAKERLAAAEGRGSHRDELLAEAMGEDDPAGRVARLTRLEADERAVAERLTRDVRALRDELGTLAHADVRRLEHLAQDVAERLEREGHGMTDLEALSVRVTEAERELAEARAARAEARAALDGAQQAEVEARSTVDSLEASVPPKYRDVTSVESAIARADSEVTAMEAELQRVAAACATAEKALAARTLVVEDAAAREREARELARESRSELEDRLAVAGFASLETYRAACLSDADMKGMATRIREHDAELETARRRARVPATSARAPEEPVVRHDLPQLERLLALLPTAREDAERLEATLGKDLASLDAQVDALTEIAEGLAEASRRRAACERVADLAGGCNAEGLAFSTYLRSALVDEAFLLVSRTLRELSDATWDLAAPSGDVGLSLTCLATGRSVAIPSAPPAVQFHLSFAVALAAAELDGLATASPGPRTWVVDADLESVPPEARADVLLHLPRTTAAGDRIVVAKGTSARRRGSSGAG